MNIVKYNVNPSSPINGGSSGYNNITVNGSNINVIDNLLTPSAKDALSANQGKVLNDNKLNKKEADLAEEVITFKKGLITDGNIRTKNFDPNVPYGFGIYKEGNAWNLNIDNIKVNRRLSVEELQIQHAEHIGGKIYCTLGGMKVSKMEQFKSYFRLYMRTEDKEGNKVYNMFRRNDLALCQTFNNNQVRRWWRKVINTGTDFIDVSISDCEASSSSPLVGDSVIQFGNTTSVDRQGALVLEPLQMLIYNNINSFNLPEPLIRLSPTTTKIDADMINFIGKTIINNKFIVDADGNVKMKDCNIDGDLKVNTLRLYANRKDAQGRLTSSFIDDFGDYKLPHLEKDEIRKVEIYYGLPSRGTKEPIHLIVENEHTLLNIMLDTEHHFNMREYLIYDSSWILYGRGTDGITTAWDLTLVKRYA